MVKGQSLTVKIILIILKKSAGFSKNRGGRFVIADTGFCDING
jgi:hypothetical protein